MISVGIIIPGFGSEYLTDAEIVVSEGRRYVMGTAHEKLYGDNIPEGCPPMPITMNVPVSCILWADPRSEPLRGASTE